MIIYTIHKIQSLSLASTCLQRYLALRWIPFYSPHPHHTHTSDIYGHAALFSHKDNKYTHVHAPPNHMQSCSSKSQRAFPVKPFSPSFPSPVVPSWLHNDSLYFTIMSEDREQYRIWNTSILYISRCLNGGEIGLLGKHALFCVPVCVRVYSHSPLCKYTDGQAHCFLMVG